MPIGTEPLSKQGHCEIEMISAWLTGVNCGQCHTRYQVFNQHWMLLREMQHAGGKQKSGPLGPLFRKRREDGYLQGRRRQTLFRVTKQRQGCRGDRFKRVKVKVLPL